MLSPCHVYRYRLTRVIAQPGEGVPAKHVAFIMLNPSTATATTDDNTIRRCCGFASAWGCHVLRVYNLFALRSSKPKYLVTHPEPTGGAVANDYYKEIDTAALIVAAWGAGVPWKKYPDRVGQVMSHITKRVWCLGRTDRGGHPRHPLFARRNTTLEIYRDEQTAAAQPVLLQTPRQGAEVSHIPGD